MVLLIIFRNFIIIELYIFSEEFRLFLLWGKKEVDMVYIIELKLFLFFNKVGKIQDAER